MKMTTLGVGAALLMPIAVGACTQSTTAKNLEGAKISPSASMLVTIADSSAPGSLSNQTAEDFASLVKSRSGGTITVNVAANAEGGGAVADAAVIAGVRSGKYDLATVPTRVWSTNGVDTMKVLQLPFEIDSPEYMAAIAHDQKLTSSTLKGLDSIGLHGVAVFPESLRHFFTFHDAVATPEDLKDKKVRVLATDVKPAMDALGATIVNPPDDELLNGIADGTITAVESDYARAATSYPGQSATAIGNLVVYAKFMSLVANDQFWSGLSDSQRSVLEQAANETIDRAQTRVTPDDTAAQEFCAKNFAVAPLDQKALDAFRRTAAASDSTAFDSTQLALVRADGATAQAPAVTACNNVQPSRDPKDVKPVAGALPNGLYRLEWTADFKRQWVKDHGDKMFPTINPVTETLNWQLKDGHYTFSISADGPVVEFHGNYQVQGDHLIIALAPEMGGVVNELRWKLADDKSLILTQVDNLEKDPAYALPWVRIGDAP